MSIKREAVTGSVIAIFFGIILLVVIPLYVEVPEYLPSYAPKSDAWPKIISFIGLLMGLILTLSLIGTLKSKKNNRKDKEQAVNNNFIKRFLTIVILFAGFALLIPIIGFLLSTTILLILLLTLSDNNKRTKLNITTSLLFPSCLYLIFSTLTNTPFPSGSLWLLLGFN